MASLQQDPSGNFHICFRFAGQRFKRSLHTKKSSEAENLLGRLEDNLRLVERGILEMPSGCDVPRFLLSDGKRTQKPVLERPFTLAMLFSEFFAQLPETNLERSTLLTMQIHQRHLLRVLGEQRLVQQIDLTQVQGYVNARAKEKGAKNRTVGSTTIKKELATFRAVWRWAVASGKLKAEFPQQGVRLPKLQEPLPFQTWEEIQRQLDRRPTEAESDLWDALYLTRTEIEELLAYVRQQAIHDFIHPMFCTAAYTGARRSELIRAKPEDIDLASGTITLHEKKRVRGALTTRRVPIAPPLRSVLEQWVVSRPSKAYLFAQRGKDGAVSEVPLTKDEARHHFDWTLAKSKWKVLRGWHVFRHSFISNCASEGIDQRFIDEWVGHVSESVKRRYRHLIPSSQQAAMNRLFS